MLFHQNQEIKAFLSHSLTIFQLIHYDEEGPRSFCNQNHFILLSRWPNIIIMIIMISMIMIIIMMNRPCVDQPSIVCAQAARAPPWLNMLSLPSPSHCSSTSPGEHHRHRHRHDHRRHHRRRRRRHRRRLHHRHRHHHQHHRRHNRRRCRHRHHQPAGLDPF